MKRLKRLLKRSLPVRTIRNRDDEAVWFFQQSLVRRSVVRAFSGDRLDLPDARPAIQGQLPDPDDGAPLLLACCDERYFSRFGEQLARSSVKRSPATRVHLHLLEPSEQCIAALDGVRQRVGNRLTVSYEGTERNPYGAPSKFYYASARFAVASELRRSLSAPIMIVDADGLVANDLASGFEAVEALDLSLFLRPELAPNYRKVLASSVYLGTSERSADFISRLADAIALSLRERPHFHVDQLSLWFALDGYGGALGLRVEPLDRRWSDYEFGSDSFIWTTKGARKGQFEELLARLEAQDAC